MIREMIEVDHEERVEQEVSDVFEPDPMTVLGAILPRLLEAQVYHAVLESLASEHSARMLAMRSATDNAGEMIESLTLIMNQARQAGITREIAEISAGAAAIH
jgi:F-type H+-transporting ATPase subunit gamma